jgi:hypothetical protein
MEKFGRLHGNIKRFKRLDRDAVFNQSAGDCRRHFTRADKDDIRLFIHFFYPFIKTLS